MAHNILKILVCRILDHLGYHFCIIPCDRVLWRCLCAFIFLHSPRLSSWSLRRAWLLWIRTWCHRLGYLGLFLLYLGCLCIIILLPLLGSYIRCPPFRLPWLGLSRPWFLGNWDFLELCFSLPYLFDICMFLPCFLFLCPCRYV
jgi:hypothetical protein